MCVNQRFSALAAPLSHVGEPLKYQLPTSCLFYGLGSVCPVFKGQGKRAQGIPTLFLGDDGEDGFVSKQSDSYPVDKAKCHLFRAAGLNPVWSLQQSVLLLWHLWTPCILSRLFDAVVFPVFVSHIPS